MFIDKHFASQQDCLCLLRAFTENNFAKTDYDFFSDMLLYANDISDQSILKCMHNVSQQALNKVQIYHTPQLYLEALTLVSWPEGKGMGLHYDNAISTGHEDTATPWRDFSAIIYLNEDFDGGELYFERGEKTHEIKPETGMMVSFDSGPSNWHGVRPCKNGMRYTMGLWFTEQSQRMYSIKPFLDIET